MSRFSLCDAVWTGLEPATPCVTGRYSNQLNYQTKTYGSQRAVSGGKYKLLWFLVPKKEVKKKPKGFA